ncbi:MAG: tetratricopeptide repeat protein, partial [Chloroflexi bacterium]|nr:tetratricopeptide repeat protein [Chloroflexota bacterium]
RRYIAPLGAEARSVLECAAMLGRNVSVPALTAPPLREYLGLGERAILGILYDQSVENRILRPVDANTISFVSGSLRDYLASHVPTPLQAHDHVRVAQALLHAGASPGDPAQHFYAGGDHESAFTYARQAGETLVRAAAFPEAVAAYQLALDALAQLPLSREHCHAHIDVLLAASFAREQAGDWDAAVEQLSEALTLCPDDPARQAEVRGNLGWLYYRKGELGRAQEYLEASAAAYEALGDETGQLQTDYYLGVVYAQQKEWGRAIARFERHIAAAEALDQRDELDMANLELGNVYRQQRQWDRAEEYLRRGLDLALETGDYSAQAQAYNYLGVVYGRQSRPEAIDYLDQALAIVRDRTKQPHLEAMIQNTRAETLVRFNRLDEAVAAFETSAAIKERIGDQAGLAMTYGGLARLYHRQWKFSRAADYYQRDLDVLNQDPAANVAWIQQITNSLGEVRRLVGDWPAAADCFQRTLDMAEGIPDETERRRSRGYSHLGLARLYLDRGELDRAREYLDLARQGLTGTWMMPEVERVQGNLERAAGNLAAAREHLDRSVAGFARGEDYERMIIYHDLARLCQDEGNAADAEMFFNQAQSLAESLGNEPIQRLIAEQRQTSSVKTSGAGG